MALLITMLLRQSCAPTDAGSPLPAYLLLLGLTASQVGSAGLSILQAVGRAARGAYRDYKSVRRVLKWGKLFAREGFKELKRRSQGKAPRHLLREDNQHADDDGEYCGSSSGDPFETTQEYYGFNDAADEFAAASEQFDAEASASMESHGDDSQEPPSEFEGMQAEWDSVSGELNGDAFDE